MTARRGFLLGFGIAAAILLAVIGWQLYQMRDSCMSIAGGGSCPTLADVAGVRYTVSVGQDLVDVEDSMTAHGEIGQTNVPQMFDGMTVYAIDGIDPGALLVARTREEFDRGDGPYRLLFVFGDERSGVWPTLCEYLELERRLAQPECRLPA